MTKWVIHVVRPTQAAAVVAEVLGGHRPAIWVSDLYGGQQGHADAWHWQVCLTHQLRDCQYAIDVGDAIFAPRLKALLLRAVVLARRRHDLAASTRREYRRRLDRDLDAIMALVPENRHGKRLRKRYAKVRSHLFTFLEHPEVAPQGSRMKDCDPLRGASAEETTAGKAPIRLDGVQLVRADSCLKIGTERSHA